MTTTNQTTDQASARVAPPKLKTSAMIASFADPGQKTTPAPLGHALAELAEQRPEIVGLSADLAKYTDMHIFREAHPERFFQMGMSEQSMMGAAAGLAEVGLVPFASTYSVFATRRAYDFLCLDIAEPNLNVNIVAALPGLTTGYGPSHQATEDVAILRGCPNLTIVDPCDAVDIEQAVPQLADHAGPTYLRLLRGAVPRVLDEYDYTFQLGKAAELRTGRDVVLISTGLMTMRALQAAARLEADHGVAADVWSVTSYKSLHRDALITERRNRLNPTEEPQRSYAYRMLADAEGVFVAASDYMKIQADALARHLPKPMVALGTDGFGRSEAREELRDFFEVDAKHIVLATLHALAQDGQLDAAKVKEARDALGIEPTKADPYTD